MLGLPEFGAVYTDSDSYLSSIVRTFLARSMDEKGFAMISVPSLRAFASIMSAV
jgi:hypothetical protein